MIKAIIPDEKLWHRRLKQEKQASQKNSKPDIDGPAPTCCWYFCWWYGP